jgi:hypothetical protein
MSVRKKDCLHIFAGGTGKTPLFQGNVVGIGFALAACGKDLGVADEGPAKQSNGQGVSQLRSSAPCSLDFQQRYPVCLPTSNWTVVTFLVILPRIRMSLFPYGAFSFSVWNSATDKYVLANTKLRNYVVVNTARHDVHISHVRECVHSPNVFTTERGLAQQ